MATMIRRAAALKPWPNGLGYDFRDWEIVPAGGVVHATRKPAWFGAATHHGTGATYAEAIANATRTDEYSTFLERRPQC